MPSEYTIRYATPLCFARTMERDGQHGVHFTCFRPLRYRAPTNEWQCGACGGHIAGGLVFARQFDW
jgi:ribosomal protein L37AE/L43A